MEARAARHAGRRTERAGRGEHRPGGADERDAGAGGARGPAGSGSSASPGRSASRSWRRPPSAGSGSRPSSRPATAPTSRATTCCSTGRPTRPRTSCCCTWSRSATRASSPGWRGGWPAPSRSIAVKSGRYAATTPGWPRPPSPIDETPACRRCSSSRASSGSTTLTAAVRHRACCWPTSRCRPGDRVAVVGNSTALGLLVADALLGEGLSSRATRSTSAPRPAPESSPPRRPPEARPVGRGRRAVVVFVPPVAMPGAAHAEALREAAAGLGQAGGQHVPRRPGRARRARGPGTGRRAGPRIGAVLPHAGAGRRRARRGPCGTRDWRTSAAPASSIRPAGIDDAGARALVERLPGRGDRDAATCSATTSASRCCAATASRCCRSGGPACRRGRRRGERARVPGGAQGDRRAVAAPGRLRRACG